MIIFAVALVRCVFVQQAVDFGALFALFIAAAASHNQDAYWAATCTVVLIAEFLYPPILSLAGTLAVIAHSIAVGHFEFKHIGSILIALLSLTHLTNRQWLLSKKSQP